MKALVTIILVISTSIYILVGGIIIHHLEFDHQTSTRAHVSRRLDRTVQQFLYNNTCVDAAELLKLLKRVVKADNQGVVMSRNVTNSLWVNDWDIVNSVFFITITLSTIGYGNIVPISPGGRAFTVVYALLGIPLQLVTLAAIGWWLSRAFDYCFFKPCHFGDDEDRSKWSIGKHIVRMLISLAIFLGFFVFVPAFAFSVLEKWTIGDGVYYAMITLFTIGFGDYEAGIESDHRYGVDATGGLYKISILVWAILGLASCASVIATMQDTYWALVRRIEDKAAELKETAESIYDKTSSEVQHMHLSHKSYSTDAQ